MPDVPVPRTADLGRLRFSLPGPGLRRTAEEILADAGRRWDLLAADAARPTVDGFLGPLNDVLVAVRDVSNHAGFLFQVHPDEAVRAVAREVSEAADRFLNERRLDVRVYARLGALDLSGEDEPTRLAVEKMRREMRRSGVERPADERDRIVELANAIDRTGNEFSGNIAAGTRWIEVDSAGSLAGLPEDFLRAHPPDGNGRIRLSTRYPDAGPVLTYGDSAEVRRRLFHEFLNVADPTNRDVLGRLLSERHRFARALGYPEYATYATEEKMLENPAAVARLLDRLARLLTDGTRSILERYRDRKGRDHPGAADLDPWDGGFWGDGYYETKLRQEEFGVDLRELRSYLPYPAVRDGLFGLCGELFGLTFRPVEGAERWHSTVEVYDVEEHGRPLGRCYLDLVPRAGKYSHAAQFEVRTGLLGSGLPQAALVCNFLDPGTPPERARMEYSHVITFFHEFGHLLHALFSGHGRWLYTTMSYLEWDFIEAPSQLFEEWARDPATLGRIARDPESGRPIPVELLERLRAADAMGRAARQLRQVALARISLELYLADPEGLDPERTFREVWDRTYPMPARAEYHPTSSWGHLGGYSACYYTYVWSAVLARDLLTPFARAGSLTDPRTAERYVREILAPGGTRKASELVRRFLGREPSFDAYESWALGGAAPPSPTS
jgi:thimet oligopeptidase